MADSKSYNQGMIDGIKLWGETCGRQGTCENCPIGSIRGTNVTCQDFAKQFPAKMLSILKEMKEGTLTYYEEYCTRFPECNLTVEELAACTCRCEKADDQSACEMCWKETYSSDVTVVDDEDVSGGLTNI